MAGQTDRKKIGARRYKRYTDAQMSLVVDLVKNKHLSSYEAEKKFDIPRRSILNKINHKNLKAFGAPTKLTEDEEEQLINVAIAASNFGCPLTKLDLRLVVFHYLQKNGKTDLFNGNPPGEKSVNLFIERHKERISIRTSQNIKGARASKNSTEMNDYFKNLKETLKGVLPSHIINYDETNLSDDPGSSKCVFKRGVKYPERVLNHSKGSISIMFAVTATGTCLPPYVVYKAENLWHTWCENGPIGTRYNRTKSGWFDGATFEDWFVKMILPWAEKLDGSKVLIGDNLASHLNISIIQKCQQHEIKFVFLPPNSSHITQPLDVSFFGPLKRKWRRILGKYKIENPNTAALNKSHFPNLLKELMESVDIINSQNIKSGFKGTGIFPLNPKEVLKKLPDENGDTLYHSIDESLLQYLKENRIPNPVTIKKNRKLDVPAGVSLSSEEMILKLQTRLAKKEEKKITTTKITKKNTNICGNKSTNSKLIVPENLKVTIISSQQVNLETSRDNTEPNNNTDLESRSVSLRGTDNVNDSIIHRDIDPKKFLLTKCKRNSVNPVTKTEEINTDINDKPSTSKKQKVLNIKKEFSNPRRDSDSSTTISDDHMSLDDSTDTENFDATDEEIENKSMENANKNEVQDEICIAPEISLFDGNFVLVKFITKKSATKYYVGIILEVIDGGVKVKFLRKMQSGWFHWPTVDDVGFVLTTDIEKALQPPLEDRRRRLNFIEDLSNYNIF